MEVRIIKEGKTDLEFELVGEDHTFCNALRQALSKHEDVVYASYKVEHPLLSSPRIYVKTKDMPMPKGTERLLPLSDIKGIGPKVEKKLRKAGIKTANALLKAKLETLEEKSGISAKVLEKYVEEAQALDYTKESLARVVLRDALKDLGKVFSSVRANVKKA